MKPASAPSLPDGTPWERLDRAFRSVFTVPKEKLLKEEAKLKQQHKRAKKRA